MASFIIKRNILLLASCRDHPSTRTDARSLLLPRPTHAQNRLATTFGSQTHLTAPKPVDYDLSQISTHVITYSDRIQRGTKEDRATPACTAALAEAGLGPVSIAAIPESADILETEIREALEAGTRFILVLGGSGFGVGNYAPEVVRSIVEVEIPGIAEQIRAHGLTNTPLSGLSREVVGVTARDSSGALIVSSPGSRGGALDTLEVVTPLLAAIFHQLDEQR